MMSTVRTEPCHRLNGLQRMMLRWEELQPVNAAHLVEVPPFTPLSDVAEAIERVRRRMPLRPLEFARSRDEFHFVDAESAGLLPVEFCTNLADFAAARTRVEQELNRPFPQGPHWPWRFIAASACDGRVLLAIVYQHALCDSRGVSGLMKRVLKALSGVDSAPPPFDYAPPIQSLVPRAFRWSSAMSRTAQPAREIFESISLRRFVRRKGVAASQLTGGDDAAWSVDCVKQTARRYNAKVHDLLLASLVDAFATMYGESNRNESRREPFAFYTPVDLRSNATPAIGDSFGQILGGYTVRMGRPRNGSFGQLVGNVAARTAVLKPSSSCFAYAQQLSLMATIWDRLPRSVNRWLGPSLTPIAGLASNVNLTSFLADELSAGMVRGYWRFTGTGPVTSMMLGLTTLGDRFNLTTTHHSDLYERSSIDALRNHVLARLLGCVDDRVDSPREIAERLAAINADLVNQ